MLDAGELMLMYGSTIFAILVASERVKDQRLWHAPWLFPGQHACMAGLATSGTLTHWFADQFGRDLDPQSAMAALAREARASPPGANGLVFLPYFSGERTPIHDPHAKGAILGLTLASTRADLYRAVIEGIAFATNHIFETYAEADPPPAEPPAWIASIGPKGYQTDMGYLTRTHPLIIREARDMKAPSRPVGQPATAAKPYSSPSSLSD